jgi:hypothetical protein
MHQRRRTLLVTLVTDREERGSDPIDNGRAADAEVLPAPHPLKRQMADLMGRLDADSRFQAGVRAARCGWL